MAKAWTIEELEASAGQELGHSEWIPVTQERIEAFARATEDLQWIHLDPERARASPLGGTIAHGFLTLSLLPRLGAGIAAVAGDRMTINYGLNRVRFTAPVPSGSRIRGHFAVQEVERVEGGARITWRVTVEREGSDKPCLVAEWLSRHHF